jgi:AcrR family transcriptional regulator
VERLIYGQLRVEQAQDSTNGGHRRTSAMNCPETRQGRSQRTRVQIKSAFTRLVFANGYENVSVREVIAGADVARSTFYEHFSGKQDVLRACMSQFMEVIARTVDNDSIPDDLQRVLSHLWENRRLTDAIFSGTPRIILSQTLSEKIEERLHHSNRGKPLALPYRLASIHLAEAQLGLIESWLRGRAYCRVGDLAEALHRTSRAAAKALKHSA